MLTLNIDRFLRNIIFLIFMLLPFSTSIEMGAVINFGVFLNYIFLPLFVVKIISVNKKHHISKLDTFILLIIVLLQAWIIFSLKWSTNFGAAFLRASYFSLGSLIFFLYLVTSSKQQFVTNLVKSVNIFSILLSIYFLSNFSFSVYEIGFAKTIVQRFVGGAMALPWGASNIISVVLICSLVTLSLSELFLNITVKKTTLLLISIAIILTLSRTGTAILVVLLGLLLLSRLSLMKSILVSLSFILIAPTAIIFSFVFLSKVDFFANRYSTSNFTSMNGRGEIWSHYLDKIGSDLFNLHGFYGALASNVYTPHNIFISFYYDTGIVGFLLLVLLICFLSVRVLLSSLKISLNKKPFTFLSILLTPLLMLLNLSFEDGIYVPATWYMFFTILVLLIHRNNNYENNKVSQ